MAHRAWLFLPAIGIAGGVSTMLYAARTPSPADGPAPTATAAPVVPVPAGSASAARAAAFELDAMEVSVGEYDACVRAGACRHFASASYPGASEVSRHFASGSCDGNRPDRWSAAMNCVPWHDADAFCRWAGKRLPTEAEWRHGVAALQASRGDDWQREASRPKREFDAPRQEWTSAAEAPVIHGAAPGLRRWCLSTRPRGTPPERGQRCSWAAPDTRGWELGFRCAR